MLVPWLASGCVVLGYGDGKLRGVWVADGTVDFRWNWERTLHEKWFPAKGLCVRVGSRFDGGFGQHPSIVFQPNGGLCIECPLWIAFMPTAVTIIGLSCRRQQPPVAGQCGRCGYDLRGNVSGCCPECGTPVRAHGR